MGWQGEAAPLIVGALGVLPRVTVEGAGPVAWCHATVGEEIVSGRRRASTGRAARCAPTALPLPAGGVPSIVLSFVGHVPRAAERQGLLAEIRQALVTNGALVVLDHSRPRRRAAALAALIRRPAVPGATLAARWRRLAYPAAREVQAAGFRVACLQLVAGERIQLVVATKVEIPPPRSSPPRGCR